MAKSSKSTKGTEPGFNKAIDDDSVDLRIDSLVSFVHPSDDELQSTEDDLRIQSAGFPPDGKATGTLSVTVTDQRGRPVSGARVRFSLSHVRPGGNWRSASGLKKLYTQNGGRGAKAERLVKQGVIRVIGTLSASSAVTGRDGVASVTYRTSHIASDFSQNSQAREKVTATLQNGSKQTLNLNIGWTGLKEIESVSGGLRVIGARGTRVHPDLRKWLKGLGNAVKDANWPHPVTVTAASLRWGGQYPPHFTHKHGLTLDLRPMSTDGASTWAKQDGTSAKNYDSDRTKALIKTLKASGGTVYFNGKGSGGEVKSGHDNHVHVSWLASNIFLEAETNAITS